MTPPTPHYFGGMILSDMDTAYSYETWLVAMLEHRYNKYRRRWSFFMAMEALMKERSYTADDFHHIPDDPLVHISEDLRYWKCLSLKRRKLTILEFEVMKYYRRKKMYPVQ